MRFLLLLPLAEIIGFVTIGPALGIVGTLLWLFGATWLGFRLLENYGKKALAESLGEEDENALFQSRNLFDGLCLLIASVLLIFPGFISDFLAIPFLVPAARSYIFQHTNKSKDHRFRTVIIETRRFGAKHKTQQKNQPQEPPPVIEGEYKRLDHEE